MISGEIEVFWFASIHLTLFGDDLFVVDVF